MDHDHVRRLLGTVAEEVRVEGAFAFSCGDLVWARDLPGGVIAPGVFDSRITRIYTEAIQTIPENVFYTYEIYATVYVLSDDDGFAHDDEPWVRVVSTVETVLEEHGTTGIPWRCVRNQIGGQQAALVEGMYPDWHGTVDELLDAVAALCR